MEEAHIALQYVEEVFQISKYTGEPVIGYNQEWYPTQWQRTSGCGPTSACNIMSYMLYGTCRRSQAVPETRDACIQAMEQAWMHVTPGEEGMPSTRMYRDGFINYAKDLCIEVEAHVLDVPDELSQRPSFETVHSFVVQGLLIDAPVAFLNLCNGDVCNLDRWHWVTIVALSYDEESGRDIVIVLDEGHVREIDLKLWSDTTLRGGGFVYFDY